MRTTEHYLTLRLAFSQAKASEAVPTTVEELSGLLCCTPRNVKLILRKLEEDGFIRWQAGRGRGNRSQLAFRQGLAEAVTDAFAELLQKGRLSEAVELMQKETLPPPVREALREKLASQFGYQVEQRDSRSLDLLRIPFRRKLSSIDPARTSVVAESHIARQITDTLIDYDPVKNEYVPRLAHAWESNRDGTQWTFFLRKGVRFHHGKRLTAEDVIFSIRRLQAETAGWMVADVLRMEAKGESVITFSLRRPNHFFLRGLASILASILPSDVPVEEKKLLGTGPFVLEAYTDERLVLTAYEDYFKERALLDRVEVWFMEPQGTMWVNYEIPSLQQTEEEVKAERLAVEQHMIYEWGCRYLSFNFRRGGPHHDQRFRQAMRLLLDRALWVKELQGNRLGPANSFTPVFSQAYEYPSHSLEEAKRLLDESTYAGETLTLYFFDLRESNEDALWIQARAAKIGLHLSLHPFLISEYYDGMIDDTCDLLLMGEIFMDDVELAYLEFFKDERAFLRRFMDAESQAIMDGMLDRFVREGVKERRALILQEVEALLRERHVILFNYHVRKKANLPPALMGVALDAFGWADFRKLWIHPAFLHEETKKPTL